MPRLRAMYLLLAIVVLSGAVTSSADLLPNTTFDTNTTGWTAEPYAQLAWSNNNAEPGVVSGSARVSNVYTFLNGSDVAAISPCIPINPTTTYVIGGQVYVESSQPDGEARIHVVSYPNADCTGVEMRWGVATNPRGSWSFASPYMYAYTSWQSIRVRLSVAKSDKSTTLTAYFDNLYFDTARGPNISSFSPHGGFPGNIVDIRGSSFYGWNPVVRFNGLAAATRVLSPTHAEAVVPNGATTGQLSIEHNYGGMAGAKFYMPPIVSGFSPAKGRTGSVVNIQGTNLDDATLVRFGTLDAASVTPVSPTSVTATVPAGAASGALQVVSPAGIGGSSPTYFIIPRAGDFNLDANADILLRDPNGGLGVWLMNGPQLASGGFAGMSGAGSTVVAVDDFSANGTADILIRDSTGHLTLWMMFGSFVQSTFDEGNPGSSYSIVGTGDFNGDGRNDILIREANGDIGMWLMNGPTIISGNFVGSPGSSYSVAGIGDFNGDGKSDILLRDSSGNLGMWLMNGAVIASGGMAGSPGVSYTVAGVGDFDGDGRADILLRDGGGTIGLWIMNGFVVASGGGVGSAAGYTIAAVRDYNGDDKADILLVDSNGNVGMWIMNGSTITTGAFVGMTGAGYTTY